MMEALPEAECAKIRQRDREYNYDEGPAGSPEVLMGRIWTARLGKEFMTNCRCGDPYSYNTYNTYLGDMTDADRDGTIAVVKELIDEQRRDDE